MKNTLFIIIVGFVILVSCKKDKTDEPVNQENVRVYTEATYFDNGNLRTLIRFSYDNEGTLKRTVSFRITDSASTDTTNLKRSVIDYTRNTDSTMVVAQSSLDVNNQLTPVDLTLLTLDDRGLCILQTKVKTLEGDNIKYYRTRYTYTDDQYLTSRYSIVYTNDSITDTTVLRSNLAYSILNGNRIKVYSGTMVVNYSHYTENVNTLNYGKSFYGRIDKNPVFHVTDYEGESTYTYEYIEGKIHKRFWSWNKSKQGMNNSSTLADSIIVTTATMPIPVFTYINLR